MCYSKCMNHLNYCRQLRDRCEAIREWPNATPEQKSLVSHAIDLVKLSQKFMLPRSGVLIEDPDLRGLDESMPLKLPFPAIALEFPVGVEGDSQPDGKIVLFVREHESRLILKLATKLKDFGDWQVGQDAWMPLEGYLTRKLPGDHQITLYHMKGEGGRQMQLAAAVLLGFLNALSCSNVRVERNDPPKPNAKLKKAIPFDSYHVLVLRGSQGMGALKSGDHRSPREHLRRGHIRRYESGMKVWVNATVVNAGVGGKVSKDYRVAS